MSAAYLTITNNGTEAVSLIGAETSIANAVELHETTVDANDIARMDRVMEINIPAGESVNLSPGGLHIMLIDLNDHLHEGETITLMLVFADGTEITVDVPVAETALDAPEFSAEFGELLITGAWVRAVEDDDHHHD